VARGSRASRIASAPTALLIDDTPEGMYEKARQNWSTRAYACSCWRRTSRRAAYRRQARAWIRSGALLADAKCPVLGHITISEKLLATLEWRNAPAFEGWMLGAEFSLDPWTLSNIHLQVQNYVLTMVLGGVFDRHP